jgi:gas vesicle protein GvpG
MGLLTLLPKLPFLPLLEVLRVAEIIRQETERQYYNPSKIRRELEEAEQRWASGGMSEDEMSRIEYTATSRLFPGVSVNQRQAPANRRRAASRRQAPARRRQTKTGGHRDG